MPDVVAAFHPLQTRVTQGDWATRSTQFGGFTYALNGSAYRGQYATGGSMMYRLNTNAAMAVGVAFSQAGGKNSAVRVRIAGES